MNSSLVEFEGSMLNTADSECTSWHLCRK